MNNEPYNLIKLLEDALGDLETWSVDNGDSYDLQISAIRDLVSSIKKGDDLIEINLAITEIQQ